MTFSERLLCKLKVTSCKLKKGSLDEIKKRTTLTYNYGTVRGI